MSGRGGAGPGSTPQESVWCIFDARWGIVTGSLPSDIKTASKPRPPFFDGTIRNSGVNFDPSYIDLALASPSDAAKFLRPGWTQTSMVVANFLDSIITSIGAKSLYSVRKDKALSEQMATQLAILWSIVFIEPGSEIHIPPIIAGNFSFQKKTMSYSDAVAFLGLKSILDATPSAIMSKFPPTGSPDWFAFRDSLSVAIQELSSKSTALHITQSGFASDWGIVSKSMLSDNDGWKGLLFPPPPSLFKVTVNATDVKMRSKPSTSGSTICLMQKGQLLYQLENADKNGWVEIFNPSAGYGFVSEKLISKDSSPATVAEVKDGSVAYDKKPPSDGGPSTSEPSGGESYKIPDTSDYAPLSPDDLNFPKDEDDKKKDSGIGIASIAVATILLGASVAAVVMASRNKKSRQLIENDKKQNDREAR